MLPIIFQMKLVGALKVGFKYNRIDMGLKSFVKEKMFCLFIDTLCSFLFYLILMLCGCNDALSMFLVVNFLAYNIKDNYQDYKINKIKERLDDYGQRR